MNGIIYKAQIKYIDTFRKESDGIIKELEDYAKLNKVPIIHWQAGDFLEFMIKSEAPKKVLEIGAAIGYSALRMARNLEAGSEIDTIEYSPVNAQLTRENVARAGYDKIINLYEGDARKVLLDINKRYDFIFLDCDKFCYAEVFKIALPLLNTGGIIFIDNLLLKGKVAVISKKNRKASSVLIREFNSLFLSEKSLQSSIYPIGDGIGIGRKII